MAVRRLSHARIFGGSGGLRKRPGLRGFFFKLILRIVLYAVIMSIPVSFLGLPPAALALAVNWFLSLL